MRIAFVWLCGRQYLQYPINSLIAASLGSLAVLEYHNTKEKVA